MMERRPPLFLFALIFLLAGCGTSGLTVDDTFQEEWSRSVDVEEYGMAEVSPDGDYVLVSPSTQNKTVMLYDGSTGNEQWAESPSLGERLKNSITVQGLSVSDLQADDYEYSLLDDGRILIFDYTVREDVMRAVDAGRSEEIWEQTGYAWTLEKFGVAGEVAARTVLKSTQDIGTAAATSGMVGAALQNTYVDNLIEPIPNQDAFLFLTRDGLVAFDAETGEERWQVADYEGAALVPVQLAPNGDLLVASRPTEVLKDLTSELNVARIDPETGEVVWMNTLDRGFAMAFEFGTRAFVENDALIVFSYNLQAFDLETGERRANVLSHIDVERGELPPLATEEDALYTTASAMREEEVKTSFGDDSRLLRIDLETGEEAWSTDETKTDIFDLKRMDDLLFVSASGDLMGGDDGVVAYDAETGEERWRSEPFEEAGTLSRASLRERISPVFVSNIVADEERLYAAGPTSIYALDPETGETEYTIAHDEETDLGLVHRLVDRDNVLGVISGDGFALYDKADGTRTYASESDRVTTYQLFADRIFLWSGDDVSVVQFSEGRELGRFTVPPPEQPVFGNLGQGVWIMDEGRTLFLLDEDGTLARYGL